MRTLPEGSASIYGTGAGMRVLHKTKYLRLWRIPILQSKRTEVLVAKR
jgi:hypothetical protein